MQVERTPDNPYGIDWTIFDKYPKSELQCRCGQVYRSYAKTIKTDVGFICVAKLFCPLCGRYDDIRRISDTSSEQVTLTKKDVGKANL